MNLKLVILFCIINFTYVDCLSKEIIIHFSVLYQQQTIANDSFYSSNKNDSLHFETIKFYISKIQFSKNNKVVFTDKIKAHLIDNSNANSKTITINCNKKLDFDAIQYNLGVDSTTNAGGALGADLDPTKGMYWAWQSGYINCKLEGKATSSSAKLHQYQFHLGGYLGSNNAMQQIVLPTKNKEVINIALRLDSFFKDVDLQATNQIMSPSKEAVILSKKVASCFSIIE
jgi:hypothetical protein